jgi:hypothetical protein
MRCNKMRCYIARLRARAVGGNDMKCFTGWCLLLSWSATVLAHHGSSEFDLSKEQRYEGTIVEHLWRNPHILTKLATHTPDGEAITLDIEGASPSVLRTGGFTADSLEVGEKVTAVVSLSRRYPKQAAYGYEIIKADGSSVPLVSARLKRLQTSQAAKTLFGTWVSTADSFSRLTRSLGTWPLNDKAREIRSKFTPIASGQAKCVPVSAPMLMVYPVAMVFEQAADHVAIKTEWLGAQRTVYTDGRKHSAAQERQQQGHSIGHWEGAVLVVDTTNFTDQETGGIPAGSSKHIVERFTLAADGKSLRYDYVLQDPEFLTGEVIGNAELSYRPDLQLSGSDCDPELAQRFFKEFQ